MTALKLHRGRLLDHLHLVVRDFRASRRFYAALLEVLGIPVLREGEDYFSADELWISPQESLGAQMQLTGRHHFAFQAKDRQTVQRWHAAGLAAGGRDNGAPGERPYHPGYYAAFLLDPDGNNVEAVFHGSNVRSAESVEIEAK